MIGFELGRRVGPPLRETNLIKKRLSRRWDQAAKLVNDHDS
ncbi:hypothetical protein [Nonomuraea sp. NPDC049784]